MAQALSPLPSAGLNSRGTPRSAIKQAKSTSDLSRRTGSPSPTKENDSFLRKYREDSYSSPFESLVSQAERRSPSRTSSNGRSDRSTKELLQSSPLKTPYRFDESTMTIDTKHEESVSAMDQSCLSTFSVLPTLDMTRFAEARKVSEESLYGPSKQLLNENSTYHEPSSSPRRRPYANTPGSLRRRKDRSSSPTPRKRHLYSDGLEVSENLLEFTAQSNIHLSPSRTRRSPPKSQTQPDLASYLARGRTPSPNKTYTRTFDPSALANLLDFEIPPAPTPRSLPTITAREMESMKSAYLSEISSLKANLSGKVAEVLSLKDAVGDAEKRVGEALEQLRDEKGKLESIQTDKENWENRGREMEGILRTIKEQILQSEREKELLQSKLDESEKRREEAESKTHLVESQLSAVKSSSSGSGDCTPRSQSKRDMEVAENVSRELHSAYKKKHDTKVAALKKSYQARWEKKVKDLETKLEEATKENEDLKTAKDSTLTGPLSAVPKDDEHARSSDRDRANAIQMAEEQKAKVKGLSEELQSIKVDNANLRSALESERVEKGELVAVVEEWLRVQAAGPPETEVDSGAGGIENLRGSISRASGLRGPGFSKMGPNATVKEPARDRSLSTERKGRILGHARSNSSLGVPRSGIMSNIERMGRGRGE